MPASKLSDKAIAVFAFAAYHQLTAGDKVVDVVLHDGAGHSADPDAIRELEAAGLATSENDRAVFTEQGKAKLQQVIEALQGAA